MSWVERCQPEALRRSVRDLIALSALWGTISRKQVAESLAEALVPLLEADFVHVSLSATFDQAEVQVTIGSQISPTIAEAILAELRDLAGSAPTVRALDWKGLGTIRVASAPIGFRGTAFLVAGAWRPDFPDDAQKFLLKFAADEAALALLRRRSEIDERRFLTLINRAPDFIGVASLEGVPHFINPAGLALVGLSSLEDARRRHILDFVAANERSRFEEAWPTVIDAGYWSGEVKFHHFQTGDEIPFLVDWFRIDDPLTGDAISLATISRDLRVQKQLERELLHLNEGLEHRVLERTQQLADANKLLQVEAAERQHSNARLDVLQGELAHAARLGAAGEMAAALAHELNQPLTAMGASVEAMKRLLMDGNAKSIATVQEIVDETIEQVDRAGQIIRRLRDFAARGDAQKSVELLQPMIHEAMALAMTGSAAQNIHFTFGLDENALSIFADRIQIQQVLFNLVRNAVEAMSEVEHKELTVSAAKIDKDTIEVCVTDSGPGMTHEIREHLFEPFHSTKRNGMGLGLSICQSIINAHGGELHYQPNPQGGAVFRFTLPSDAGGEVDAE